jgi:hypothetical protein
MSNSDSQGRDIAPKPSTTITVGPLGAIPVDLASLTDEERAALAKDYARGMIDIDKKARELKVEGDSLKYTLETLGNSAKQNIDSGAAITLTHSQTTKVGRTEIKIGNTEEAKTGKLSSSQTGDTNWTPYYILGGLVAIVLIAFLFAGHH